MTRREREGSSFLLTLLEPVSQDRRGLGHTDTHTEKHCRSIYMMHLTILYRDILCNVGKGWFSTRDASEKPAFLALCSLVLERCCSSNDVEPYRIQKASRLSERVVRFPNCQMVSREIVRAA